MEILELNSINMHEILKEFNQGRNSDGNDRKPKFKITKNNIENFVVFKQDYTEISDPETI